MEISPLDLDDRDMLTGATGLVRAAIAAGASWLHAPTVDQLAGALRHGHDGEGPASYVGLVDGRVVALGSLHMSSRDNLDSAWMDVTIHPEVRSRGLGTELHDHLKREASALGRTKLGAAAWEDSPGVAFAARHGYEARSQAILRRQHLDPAGLERIVGLRDRARAAARDYEVLRLVGPLPDDLLEPVALVAESINDAPLDDLDLEPDVFDAERLRGYDVVSGLRGRTVYRTVARHRSTGELTALSVMAVEQETPGIAYQHDTTVVPAHRGHRLGLLLKAEMLLWLAEAEPALRTVDTWNAESNHHMVAVNESLGYRWTARQLQFQKVVR